MHDIHENQSEKVILVGVKTSKMTEAYWNLAWAELQGLVETAGGTVVAEMIQNRDAVDRSTLLGSGKLIELAAVCKELQVETAAFLGELTPSQVRSIEAALPCRVVDRTQVILDIFASRARSYEGKLQVELAQLGYLLPRLTGKGAALSRLGGGIGTRGPGETKLETDRRHIRGRMNELRQQMSQVRTVRTTQRRTRTRQGTFSIALVGYTNAGKTSLMNTLLVETGSHKEAIAGRNRLFDTLDPTSRKLDLDLGKEVVLTDTVGFIQDLPHSLVDAFRSTLEETLEADLLLHVVDMSHPEAHTQMQTVYHVLDEIQTMDCPVITVYNKMDLCPNLVVLPDAKSAKGVRISTVTGEGITELIKIIQEQLTHQYVVLQLKIPYESGDLLSKLYEVGTISSREDQEDGVYLVVKLPEQWVSLFDPYQLKPQFEL